MNRGLSLPVPPAPPEVPALRSALSPMLRTFGCAIRSLRHERRVTMEALAEAAGLSYQYLSEVERGQTNFSIMVLERLAVALQVALPDLAQRAATADPATAPMLRRVRSRAVS